MCGLVGVFSKRNKRAGQYAFEIYTAQKSRGQRGYGYIGIKDGYVVSVERALSEEGIKPKLLADTADAILFHHRLPTSTDNSIGTTHPIFVSNESLEYDYYVSHNGIITNPITLNKQHEELGFKYTTKHHTWSIAKFEDGRQETMSCDAGKFNDSESLAIEIARYMEGQTEQIGTTGSVAFWCVAVNKETSKVDGVYYGKNYGRELGTRSNNKWFVLASQQGEQIAPLKLFSLDITNFTTTETELNILDTAEPVKSTYYQSYGYHTQHLLPKSNNVRDVLVDKDYTRKEVEDSGFPYSDFKPHWVGTALFYVPTEFYNKRPRNIVPPKDDDKVQYSEKAVKRLEELALEYADEMAKSEKYESDLKDGSIDYDEYRRLSREATDATAVAEDLMSSLGLPQEMVDEAIDNAMDLWSYQTSYAQS